MLRVEHLDVFHGDAQALDDVSIEIGEGTIVAIVGANGAGKTSLIRTIAGMYRPARGRIVFRDTDIGGWESHRVCNLGIGQVAEGRQVFSLYPHNIVYPGIMLAATILAVNVLGDVHGGAGEQAVELYQDVAQREDAGATREAAVAAALQAYRELRGKFVSGFGHRFHPLDPRAPRLLALVDQAAAAGVVSGRYAGIARAVEQALGAGRAKPIPMNIDGATAVIYAELGFPAPLARGLFCLSRSVGILSHAWEQTQQGGRNKGPIPRQFIWTYDGVPQRDVPGAQ